MLVALAGGVGAARLLAGLVQVAPPPDITAVVNTGDDLQLHGLHISPDIDTVIYTLAGAANPRTGWGLDNETWTVMDELEHLGGSTWFRLGDRDLATHLYRTGRLAEGATLTSVTGELARRRQVGVRILPVSDDRLRTKVTLAGPPTPGAEVDFQDYFVRLGHGVAVSAVRVDGAEGARPAPGVLEAIRSADVVVVCPSNPVVSIGPILAVPGIRGALEARRRSVVAVSPIVAGKALKGPADRLLRELGHESSAAGVARLYAPFAATVVIDVADAPIRDAVEAAGTRCVVAPTIMDSPLASAALARVVLDAAG